MNIERVLEKLKKDYPGKNIILNPLDDPTEIVCEVNPANGKAIAIIDRSTPHLHHRITEHYLVLKGHLHVFINDEQNFLAQGEELDILPEQAHYAIGEETWVEVTSTPPWSLDDHIIL